MDFIVDKPLRAVKKNFPRRYVKVEFFGYAPIDLAIQIHLLGKKCDINTVGGDLVPYEEYQGDYDKLTPSKTQGVKQKGKVKGK